MPDFILPELPPKVELETKAIPININEPLYTLFLGL